MTTQELIHTFNPANAKNLTEADIEVLRNLTDEQLLVLAEAYPNTANRRPYLVLFDKNLPENKQVYQQSTFRNLYNVRKLANQRHITAYSFKDLVFPLKRAEAPVRSIATATKKGAEQKKRVSMDLSPADAAAELKQATAEDGKKESGNKKAAGGNKAAKSETKPPKSEKKGNKPVTIPQPGADASEDFSDGQATPE